MATTTVVEVHTTYNFRNQSELTTSSLITAICAVSCPITAIRRADTLAVGTPKCSTWAENCNRWFNRQVSMNQKVGEKIVRIICATYVQGININSKMYRNLFHHFHQSMSWSQYIVQWRRYTGHWYIETGSSCNLGTSYIWQGWMIMKVPQNNKLFILSNTMQTLWDDTVYM